MSANEISPKINRRLKRIRKVVLAIRIFIGLVTFAVAAIILFVLSNSIGLTNTGLNIRNIDAYFFSKYDSLSAIPVGILLLHLVRAGLFFAGAAVLDRLLRFFARGIFFTAANITCIKQLGGLVISYWVVLKLLDAFSLREVSVGVGDFACLTVGLFTFLIAWIMDEGRKIQEEQELTV